MINCFCSGVGGHLHCRGLAVLALFTACVIPGCDDRSITSVTTAPAESADRMNSDRSAQSRTSIMLIDQAPVQFPPAKLALRSKGGQLLALLYSDDPPSAIEENYTGNSYYIEMLLDVPDAAQLATARWSFRAPSSERAETSSGIYLEGRKRHLQPFDVTVEFEEGSIPSRVTIWLSGQFLLFDSDQDATVPGMLVPVRAQLDAERSIGSSRR